MTKTLAIIAATAMLSTAAIAAEPAAGTNTGNQPPSAESSGPGVKGAPGGTAGPALKIDPNSGASTSGAGVPAGATGAGTGEQGQGATGAGMEPSDDATGVKGAPGGTAGPAEKKPSEVAK